MGTDKATLVVEGERLADRAASVLGAVCDPVLEVGPGHSALEAVREDPSGEGPLAALAAGGAALGSRGYRGDAIVLAVDLPLITAPLLRFLADWPPGATVVPFVSGQPQPVCARYSADALALARDAVRGGERSIRAFLGTIPEVQWAGPRMWGSVADERAFSDVDTPEDLRRLGLAASTGEGVEQ
jgi:molybdopterin-guanine dinucleotide biosynthesis protein A